MWFVFYRSLLWLAYPVVRARLWWRARREPAYGERVAERFGRVPDDVPSGVLWFHTVSAGETIAAAPWIRALVDDYPTQPFLVTTMTPTGSAQVLERLGARVAHCYAPYDFPAAVERFYRRVEPRLLVLMETELWPNLIDAARRRGVPVLLVNARLSARSAAGYAKVAGLTRTMLAGVDVIACQSDAHRARFIDLGAATDRVTTLGSVKFDVTLPDAHAAAVAECKNRLGLEGRRVWVAGSTHPGEEEAVLDAHRRLLAQTDEAALVIVPRHPHRAPDVTRLARRAGFEAAVTSQPQGNAQVWVGDLMGQLQTLYGLAEVAFVGGSLVPLGGHNPIEAAICRVPALTGPHVFNFTAVVDALRAADALRQVDDAQALAQTLCALFADPDAARSAGARGAAVVAEQRGATQRLLTLLRGRIDRAVAERG